MNAQKSLSTEVMPLTVTLPEAARLVGVSEGTVRALIRCGRLPSMHIERRHLVRVAAIERYLQEQEAHDLARVRASQDMETIEQATGLSG